MGKAARHRKGADRVNVHRRTGGFSYAGTAPDHRFAPLQAHMRSADGAAFCLPPVKRPSFSFRAIAGRLTETGIRPPKGGDVWNA